MQIATLLLLIHWKRQICSIIYYFNSVFSKPCKEPVPPRLYPIVPPLRELLNVVVSVKEVESILKNLDPSKSPGPDGLTSQLLKEVASEISSPIIITVIFK